MSPVQGGPPFFQDAERLGPIYGFNFNRKNQAILLTNGTAQQEYLPPDVFSSLNLALATYTDNKPHLDGFKLLGIPMGNLDYVQKEMNSTLANMATTAFNLLAAFPDQQKIYQSYVTSVIAKIPYRVGSDAIAYHQCP